MENYFLKKTALIFSLLVLSFLFLSPFSSSARKRKNDTLTKFETKLLHELFGNAFFIKLIRIPKSSWLPISTCRLTGYALFVSSDIQREREDHNRPPPPRIQLMLIHQSIHLWQKINSNIPQKKKITHRFSPLFIIGTFLDGESYELLPQIQWENFNQEQQACFAEDLMAWKKFGIQPKHCLNFNRLGFHKYELLASKIIKKSINPHFSIQKESF